MKFPLLSAFFSVTTFTGSSQITIHDFPIHEITPPVYHSGGNGKIARVMMNAELSSKGLSRIMIPTVFRSGECARAFFHFFQISQASLPE
jgi:hypothetical protein